MTTAPATTAEVALAGPPVGVHAGRMISLASLLGVTAVALGMVLTPGPNMMYLVSRSITQGRRAGIVSLGGVAPRSSPRPT